MQYAIVTRAHFYAAFAVRANEYGCEAFPKSFRRKGFIASNASISNCVVAAWSAYTFIIITQTVCNPDP